MDEIWIIAIMSRAITKASTLTYIRRYLNDNNGDIWSDAYLNQLINQAEQEISGLLLVLWIRFSLETMTGVATYQMPPGISRITRITYRGFKVDLLSQKELALLSPVYRTQQSRPRWASLQFEGFYTLRLYPYPAENLLIANIPSGGGGGLFGGGLFGGILFGGGGSGSTTLDANINALTLVSTYYTVDEGGTSFSLPDYFVRRIVKLWVLIRAYACEGNGQNLEISSYYSKRYDKLLVEIKNQMEKVYATKERQFSDTAIQRPWRKHHPILPPNFGTRVLGR